MQDATLAHGAVGSQSKEQILANEADPPPPLAEIADQVTFPELVVLHGWPERADHFLPTPAEQTASRDEAIGHGEASAASRDVGLPSQCIERRAGEHAVPEPSWQARRVERTRGHAGSGSCRAT